jgi:hypothetical protein
MLNHPTCLHIPDLYEDSPAQISWGSVDDAVSYQLDCVFDMTFDQAPVGRSWADLEASGQTWAQIEEKNLAWSEIEKLPARFVIFDGQGEPVPGPDHRGLTWAYLDSQGKTWAQIEADGLTWQEFEFQSDPADRGISWAYLDSQEETWSQIEARGLTWNEFENLKPDNKTHRAFTTFIPVGHKSASFRVRAFDGMNYSDYLTSPLIPIIPVSPVFHEDNITLSAVNRSKHIIQLQSRKIEDFQEIIMKLQYDPVVLHLEKMILERPTDKTDMGNSVFSPNIQVFSQISGEVQFRCIRQMKTNKEWSGLVVSAHFGALQTGNTVITLS